MMWTEFLIDSNTAGAPAFVIQFVEGSSIEVIFLPKYSNGLECHTDAGRLTGMSIIVEITNGYYSLTATKFMLLMC